MLDDKIRKHMAVESGSIIGLAAITKYGWIKLLSLGSALLGAGIMAIFRPPKSRQELFTQGAVALGCSLLFGHTVANVVVHYFPFLSDLSTLEDLISFHVSINGLVGAMSWGIFGGLAHWRDKIAEDPTKVVQDVKSL